MADLKTIAQRYSEDEKKSGTVTSPHDAACSSSVV